MAKKRAGRDRRLHDALKARLTAALERTGTASFVEHLLGSQAALRSCGPGAQMTRSYATRACAPPSTARRGPFALPWTERSAVPALIGARAERHAWLFCAMDRASLDSTALLNTLGLAALGSWWPHLGGGHGDQRATARRPEAAGLFSGAAQAGWLRAAA